MSSSPKSTVKDQSDTRDSVPKGRLQLPDLGLGEKILTDQEKYYSREHAEREWKELWCRTWNLAGRVSDVARKGDYFTFDLGRESFIITRSSDDVIRAFYNVCQHRGARLVNDSFGQASTFVCPFHSWSWRNDGSLRSITDEETFPESVICDRPGLSEVRCEIWGGFVFINMDTEAEPLLDFLGAIREPLDAYHFEDMIVAKDYTALWPFNWKVSLDAFMEGYHAHARHPELVRMIDDVNFDYDFYGNGHSSMIIPMGLKSPRFSDRATLTPELRYFIEDLGLKAEDFEGRQRDVRRAVIDAKRKWAAEAGLDLSTMSDSQVIDDGNYNLFPNITLNAHPEGVLVMRFRPHETDPDLSYYDVIVLSHTSEKPDFKVPFYMAVPEGTDLSGNGPRPERVFIKHGDEGMGLVLDQDSEFLPTVQAGLKSKGFKGVRLCDQEIRLRYYYSEYDKYLEGGE